MTPRPLVLSLSRVEAAHVSALVTQFADLLEDADVADPAVARLVPPGYADAAQAREFRSLTESDLLARRRGDASRVLGSLAGAADLPDEPDDAALMDVTEIRLDPDQAQAWLRTLAAIRLVLASRLGITHPEDEDREDPRFGVYEWLGMRLDGLVAALDEG